MNSKVNRRWLLKNRPQGALSVHDFDWTETSIPDLKTGSVLIRNLYLSLDPANRGWVNNVPTYRPPVALGDVMAGFTVGKVIDSNRQDFSKGDLVEGEGGWQDYTLFTNSDNLYKLPNKDDLITRISLLGITGKTAYWGLLDIGIPESNNTVVISAAAGAVGSISGQIAKIKGCRTIGIAGTDDKCKWITEKLGFDAAINYKTENVSKLIRKYCPDGVDIYFDNVGGEILQAILFNMNQYGRIVCCGVVSQYDTAKPEPGPHGIPGFLVVKRLKMQGFIVLDYEQRRKQAENDLITWAIQGKIQNKVDILNGLESAPDGLIGLLHGANTGKRIVRI